MYIYIYIYVYIYTYGYIYTYVLYCISHLYVPWSSYIFSLTFDAMVQVGATARFSHPSEVAG